MSLKDLVVSASHAGKLRSTPPLNTTPDKLPPTSSSSTHVSGISEDRLKTLLMDMKGSASTMVPHLLLMLLYIFSPDLVRFFKLSIFNTEYEVEALERF